MNPMRGMIAKLLGLAAAGGPILEPPARDRRRSGEGAEKRSDRMKERFAGVKGNWERAAGQGRMGR